MEIITLNIVMLFPGFFIGATIGMFYEMRKCHKFYKRREKQLNVFDEEFKRLAKDILERKGA